VVHVAGAPPRAEVFLLDPRVETGLGPYVRHGFHQETSHRAEELERCLWWALAKCQFGSIGCTKPETGDRVFQIEIVIKNTSDAVASWGSDYFVLEFPDGTQVLSSDGNAYEYSPDNATDVTINVRPGTTFRSPLVFEAPNGPFSILVLTSEFDGVPFAAWS